MPNTIDYTTLTFDQLREPYLRAEGWGVADSFQGWQLITKGGAYFNDCDIIGHRTQAEAWSDVPITTDSLLGPGGAMERAMKKRWVFAVGIYDDDDTIQCKFGDYAGHIRIVRGSDALCRAVMIATIISHEQENTEHGT